MADPRLVLAPHGTAAFDALAGELDRIKDGDPLARATIVVPSNYVGVATRRRLAARGVAGRAGLAGVTILTGYRLAELLGAPPLAADGRRPVSTPVLAAGLRGQLRKDAGVFAPLAEHVATEQALVKAYRDLSDLDGAQLDAVAAQSRRAADVVRLHRSTRSALSAEWYDEADLVEAAVAAIAGGASLLDDLGEVVVHLPRRLRPRPAELLRALARHRPLTVVGGLTGGQGAESDADLRRTAGLLGLAWPAHPEVPPARTDLVISSSDADDEVRAAIREVVSAAREGTPLERTAIVFGAHDPYARLVHEYLEAAGLPHNGTAVRPVADRMVARFLLGALRLPERAWRRDVVMGLVTGAPVLGPDGRRAKSAAWEQRSREAGVVAGLDDWDRRLTGLAERKRAEAAEEEQAKEPRDGRIEHLRREASESEELRSFVLGLADRLANVPRRWGDAAEWAHELLAVSLGGDSRRGGWPEVELDAAHTVEEALDRLAGLDEVDPSTSLDVFARTLEIELESDLGRVGHLGSGVLVGGVDDVLGLDLDLIVVVGLAEGSYPARRLDDSLLPDHEREVTGGALRTRADETAADHHDLLAALASATRLVTTFPRGDLRKTAERVPSRWLLDLVERRRGQEGEDGWVRALPHRPHPDWFAELPSFAGSIRRIAFGASAQEHRLAVLEHHRSTGGEVASHDVVRDDPALRRGIELRSGRDSFEFTRFDGNLSGHRVPSPADPGHVMGPTRLETYVANPHRYLMETILRVQIEEDPTDELEMSAVEYGNVVHVALERFLDGVVASGRAPAPGQPWSDADRSRLLEIAWSTWDEFAARGLVGRPVFERRDRIRLARDLTEFLDHDDDFRRQMSAVPVAAELGFGFAGADLGPVAFELGDGRQVRFRGSADRVDRTEHGAVVVTDYKTGSTRRFGDITPEAPTAGGTKLQLPVYALAGRAHAGDESVEVHVRYWFVTARQRFDEIGYQVDSAVLDEFGQVLTVIVDEIEAGHFPMRPPEPVWRPWVEDEFADPDGLGTADRWREWERVRTAPVLRRLVELADGIPDPEEEGA